MKRHLLLLGAMAIALASNAQSSSIGITVGSGTGWMNNTGQHVVHKESCNVGASYIYSSETHWGWGVDVKYSREGFKYTYAGTGDYQGQTLDTRVSSDFIRVPLRGIYFFNKHDKAIRPNISLGPSFGFLTGGRIRNEDADRNNISKGYVNDYYKSFDFGIQGTAGVSFRLATALWLSADIAYYQGLMAQNKNGTNNVTNSNLVLNLGLRMGIGK